MHKNYGHFIESIENFDSSSQLEQVKYISYFYCIINGVEEITATVVGDVFDTENLSRPGNVSDCLSKLSNKNPPVLIKKGNIYRFHRTIKKELDSIYLDKKHIQETSKALRELLLKVISPQQKSFLEEAIVCYEVKAYRASIVMTWLLTIDVLFEHVINYKISDFNEAMAKNSGYKNVTISGKESFTHLKSENDFITLLKSASIITGDQKKILEEKLGIRNTSAHPNSIEVKESKATNFIEDLIANVVSKFQ
ncbi:MAG: hypothetical protein V4565_05125 [Bacteroidota bacterium]